MIISLVALHIFKSKIDIFGFVLSLLNPFLKAYLMHTATEMFPGQYGQGGASQGRLPVVTEGGRLFF